VTQQQNCHFCEIVANKEPARIVMRTANVVAFFPQEPATLGHTLVIPTDHIADIWELDEATAVNLTRNTLRVARAVKQALSPDGLNIIQSNGAAATQTVGHLHVHVVPRWTGDAMAQIWPSVSLSAEQSEAEVLREQKALQAIRDRMIEAT
jgi:histidine triad (HIT) family protein